MSAGLAGQGVGEGLAGGGPFPASLSLLCSQVESGSL